MEIVTENDLVSALDTITGDLTGLRTEVREIRKSLEGEWKTGFQAGVTDLRQLVKQIGENLDRDIKARTEENLEIKNELAALKAAVLPLSQTDKRYQFLKGVLAAGILSIAAVIVSYALQNVLKYL